MLTFSQTKCSPGEQSQAPEQGLLDPQNHVKLWSQEIKELGWICQQPEILFYCQTVNGHWRHFISSYRVGCEGVFPPAFAAGGNIPSGTMLAVSLIACKLINIPLSQQRGLC